MGPSRGRRRQRDKPEIDLLTTAFNLPTRRTVERDERRGVQRVTTSHGSDHGEDDSSITSESSLSSEYEEESEHELEEQRQPSRRPSPPPRDSTSSRHTTLRRLRSAPESKEQDCLKLSSNTPRSAPKVPVTRRPRQRNERKISRGASPLKTTPKRPSIQSSATIPQHSAPHMPLGMNDAYLTASSSPGSIASPFTMATPAHPAPQLYHQPHFSFIQTPTPAQASQPVFPLASQQQATFTQTALHHSSLPQQPPSQMAGELPNREGSKTTAGELERIQHELDQKTAALGKCPGNGALKTEVKSLREQLNSTLNGVMGRPMVLKKPSAKINDPSEATQTAPVKTFPEAPETHNHPKTPPAQPNRGASSEAAQPSSKPSNQQRDKRPSHEPFHHVCFGCGSVRSRKYHEKHPLAPGKPIMPSLCEGCRERVHQKEVMEHHCRHVCFGCGIYRSKRFHERHPADPGDPLLPNYCSRCQIERHAAEETADCPTGQCSSTQTEKENHHGPESQRSPHREPNDEPLSPPPFSRGAFSMDSGFEANAWDWSKFRPTNEDNDRASGGGSSHQASPNWVDEDYMGSPTEPLTPGQSFEETWEDDVPSPPHNHPPRSAFSSFFNDAPKDYGAKMSQGPTGSHSAPVSPGGQTFPETARNH